MVTPPRCPDAHRLRSCPLLLRRRCASGRPGAGRPYVDLRGMDGHYRDEFVLAGALVEAVRGATGLLAGAGIAGGKFVAWVAASITPPGDAGVVLPGREREFLRDKDVSLLLLRSAQDKLFGAE